MTKTVLKEKLSATRVVLDKLFHSDYYIVLLALITFFGWLSNDWVPFLFVSLTLTIVMFAVCENTLPLFPFMWFFISTMSATGQDIAKYGWMLFMCLPLVGAIVYNFVHYKPNLREVLKPDNIKRSTLSMFLLIIAMSFGGLFRSGRQAFPALVVVALFVILAFSFAYFMAVFRKEKDSGRSVMRYMVKLMFIYSLLVSAQIAVECLRTGSFEGFMELAKYKLLELGWASANPAAAAVALGIPANFYFMIKNKKYAFVFLIIAALEYFAIFVTGSRGALLFAGIMLPVMYIYTMIKTENRKQLAIASGVFAVLLIGAGIACRGVVADGLSVMLSKGMSDNGRFDIYRYGLEVFMQNPVFGAGWEFGLGQQHVSYSPYLFHSTVIQILACSGIVGMLIYGYYYFARFSTFFVTTLTPEKAAIFAAMLIFEGYGLIDPVVFIPPTFFIMLLTLAIAVEQSSPENTCKPLIWIKICKKASAKKSARPSA